MAATAAPPDLRYTIGSLQIGTFFSTAMYGFTTYQTLRYYQLSWNVDSLWMKLYVLFVWLLETVHTALCWATTFRLTIVEFGNYAAIAVTAKSDDMVTFMTGMIMLLVHLFYIRRIWILSNRNIIVTSLVTLFAIGHFGLEMAVVALTMKFPAFDQFHKITAYYTGSLALAAADDILIAVALCYLLTTRRTGIRTTDTLVNKIITYSVMTGAITSVLDLAILICFVAMPNNLVYIALYDMVPNMYIVSFLAMLNTRDSLHNRSPVHTTTSALSMPAFALGDLRTGGRSGSSGETATRARDDSVSTKMAFGYPSATDTVLDA